MLMQLNIEFYSKEEYAIEQNNSDQYPFSSSSDNDLFAFCSFTIRVLQNLEKHPLGKVLAILLKNMDNENIKEIVNHSYLFPGFHDLDEMTRSVGPRLSPAMLLAIDQDILMKYPLQVQYRGRGDKSFYLSMPPFRFKNNGFGIFGKEINYFGFHSVFCFLNYFAKKYSGQDKFTDSLCRIANYSGICKLSDKIPFSDTFNYSNEIFEIVKEEIKKIYINSMQEKEKEEIKKHRLNETIEGLNIKELNEKALTARMAT